MANVQAHVMGLAGRLLEGLLGAAHRDGQPLVRVYGPRGAIHRGGTVAFNVLTRDGRPVPYTEVERRARDEGVAIRSGCFCNPGAAVRASVGLANNARDVDRLIAVIETFAS